MIDPNDDLHIQAVPTARHGERPNRQKAIAEQAAEKVLTDLQRQVPMVVAALTGQFEGQHTEVSKEEYLEVRRAQMDDPAKVQLWMKQVGPTAFFDEFFEITKPPKEWKEAYMHAIELGAGNVDAIKFADKTTLPAPPAPIPIQSEEPVAGMLSDVQPGEPMLGQPEPEMVNPAEMMPQPGEPMLGQPQMPVPQPPMPPMMPPPQAPPGMGV